ncbi:phage regulatory protein [Enterococcus faecalis]|uniref:Rha family transcriptional regulator n=1 Tax=Enterococcus TaxID=1350 RepID=UPI0003543720|nr:phage regulatory protein [Enterococcus faecalis]EPH81440.1 phage regulatory protein, Rha family [Enterococcus faecalis 06-MB-S-10]EPH87570.1 phage regulatory protein, Rha family [Enterococcus faecalis 06-MB-S-04]EPH88419.1 phage regulatory protein, Rha family [Enterococcus faecalis F01966]MCU2242703.1 phage regulatory protein [Enterococcus faecalis]MDN3108536.1 phage regulatory protein [Enterococcus faecalis]
MENLVITKNQQAVTTSLQVAETFNKNHRDVLAAIDDLKEGVAENYADLFYEDSYIHPQNKQKYRQIIMNRDGFTLLAMGFTGQKALKFKLKYIEAFNQMEKEIQQPKLPTSQRELALLALSANEETNERVDNIDARVSDLEENKLITTEDKGTIDRRVRKKVYYLCKEQHLGQKAKSMLFQDLGSSIKQLFNVPNRGRIKDKDFHRVLEFIDNWQPSSVTKEKIKQIELRAL